MIIKEFRGKVPKISEKAFVAENAAVLGDVEIKDGASIWYGAVLRGDTDKIVIGEGTNIQDNATIHPDKGYAVTIGKNVTIGHNCVIHGCTIQDGALIGMGAIVLSGAVVEKGALVAAGAVVGGNVTVPSNTLALGNPLVLKGEIKESLKNNILDGHKLYQEFAKEYLKQQK